MELREFPIISLEHRRGSTFKKYKSQDLAPVWLLIPISTTVMQMNVNTTILLDFR